MLRYEFRRVKLTAFTKRPHQRTIKTQVGPSKPSNSPVRLVGPNAPSNSPNGRVGSNESSNSPVWRVELLDKPPQGILLCVFFWIPIETLFILSQSEFPLRFYDKNKLEAQHPARNQASWIYSLQLASWRVGPAPKTFFVSSQSKFPLRFYDENK